MLIIPIIALIFIGVSYFFANRLLPPKLVMKATTWTAGAAFVSYYATQIVAAVISTMIVGAAVTASMEMLPIFIGLSILGAIAGGALVMRGFVTRHRRRKAEREAQATVF